MSLCVLEWDGVTRDVKKWEQEGGSERNLRAGKT